MKRQQQTTRKLTLTTMKKECPECYSVQFCFFGDQKSFNEWTCPVCNGRIDADEDFISDERKSEIRNRKDSDEVPLVTEDSVSEQDEPPTTDESSL